MITQEKIDRINELAHKKKETGLTPAEQAEQDKLRKEYVEAFRASLRGQLDNTVILRPDGTKERVSDYRKKNGGKK